MNALRTADAADVIGGVRPAGRDADPEAVLAAGAWTCLVEPGDSVAGALVGALGPVAALDALRRDAPPFPDPQLRRGFDRWRPRLDDQVLLAAFRNAARIGARLVLPGDDDWPAGLDDLDAHAPLGLWALAPDGPLPSTERSVALVGSRSATDYGVRVTQDIGCGLADLGFAIVSGGALGVDRIAHLSALASGGLTAAVLAGGPDRLYPESNSEVLHRIAREGVVLTEMPPGARPMRERFLKRNRLIAALARVTVVVEAGARSGASNTAAHAAQLGRAVGAVPGSVYSATSAGTHAMIREIGAILVRNAADVAELAADPDAAVTLDGVDRMLEDPHERVVRDVLTTRPRSVLEVAARAGLSVGDASAALGMLALMGAAIESGGGWSRA